jgi:hypothetical protein
VVAELALPMLVAAPPELLIPVVPVKVSPPVSVAKPEALRVVMPATAPAVLTVSALDVNWKVPVELPMAVVPVPEVLIVVVPVMAAPPAVTVSPPAEIVAPPVVTVRPVPMVALFVTDKPVPAAVKLEAPLNVLAPDPVWV